MTWDPWVPDIDLGNGHSLIWTDWNPDPALNPKYADLPPYGPGEHHGAILRHPRGPHPHGGLDEAVGEGLCEGAITFDTARARAGSFTVLWQVQSWDPLTISPSVLCDCGDHGFIREGKWVPIKGQVSDPDLVAA